MQATHKKNTKVKLRRNAIKFTETTEIVVKIMVLKFGVYLSGEICMRTNKTKRIHEKNINCIDKEKRRETIGH